MLAQFYARRATAISSQMAQAKGSPTATDIPGTPDKEGIYRVVGGVPPPQRMDIPRYPPDAKAAGVGGVVLAEVVVNEQGVVPPQTNGEVIRVGIPVGELVSRAARSISDANHRRAERKADERVRKDLERFLAATANPTSSPSPDHRSGVDSAHVLRH
jgi:hypothetical protein